MCNLVEYISLRFVIVMIEIYYDFDIIFIVIFEDFDFVEFYFFIFDIFDLQFIDS